MPFPGARSQHFLSRRKVPCAQPLASVRLVFVSAACPRLSCGLETRFLHPNGRFTYTSQEPSRHGTTMPCLTFLAVSTSPRAFRRAKMGRRSLQWEPSRRLRTGASLPPRTKQGPPPAIRHRPLTLLSLITISELHHPRRSCGHECPPPRSLLLPELMPPSGRYCQALAHERGSLNPVSAQRRRPLRRNSPKSVVFIFPFLPVFECLRRSSSFWAHSHLTLLCRRLPGSISQAPSPPQAPGPTPDLRNVCQARHGVVRGVATGS
ncbi:hypothetical protein PHLGIDRAFT_202071 [Phlebiopsis gigantea 11061_1 CR5-6]|uniref:Uncharacterized protein n=1 Tax=Phlebiopsis gigantea (strain 11061_1 CR5-6) TaxID=745531 RepID=A0A0C3RTW5_PHLG1|nr:hypothetical protein PHLGIDRAFT_202071 [Phlebiopsis gigantea 11061_1 CR5-6]